MIKIMYDSITVSIISLGDTTEIIIPPSEHAIKITIPTACARKILLQTWDTPSGFF